jgi:hypothetical protein
MPNRKRRYADFAGTFLLWVEEAPDHPPPLTWSGHVLMRPTPYNSIKEPWYEPPFSASSEAKAKKDVEETIRNHPAFHVFAHRLSELEWSESNLSEDEWEEKRARFITGHDE